MGGLLFQCLTDLLENSRGRGKPCPVMRRQDAFFSHQAMLNCPLIKRSDDLPDAVRTDARKPFGMQGGRLTAFSPQPIGTGWNAGSNEASWRSGYAEDCKSLHPGSIPGEASNARAPARQRRGLKFLTQWTAVLARQADWLGHER